MRLEVNQEKRARGVPTSTGMRAYDDANPGNADGKKDISKVPRIIQQPQHVAVLSGAVCVFTCDVVGEAPLFFQWFMSKL